MVLMEFADVVMFFFFNDTATTEIYTLSLHDALPICYGSGMTCWRRLRDWNAAGVWEQLHQAMLTRLREHDQIDWSRASIDGSSVDRKSTRLNSSHSQISYAVFCLKKKKNTKLHSHDACDSTNTVCES